MPEETAVYTHGHHESVLRSHFPHSLKGMGGAPMRTAANSAGYLLPWLRPGMTLLDVGCGPGTITADLAQLVAPGRVTAVDHSADILTAARAVAAERGLDQVEFRQADVHVLDFPDDTFDVVHAHQVLQHVGDPVQALREMRRVCRPGGTIAVRESDYAAMTWYPRLPALDTWQELYGRVARANGGEPDAGRRLLAWARAAGCTEIAASSATWCFATPEDRAWWSGLWADRTVGSDYARIAVDGGHTTADELARIAGAWRTWGAHPDGWFSVLHGEIRCRA
ncbi:class I SAM-dependent methyltransferase [Streptomyces gobiensis]|uniref:class I SAM-dependent methyltransferase n=1 Tax=Streptomyces gobiensis TaxID=2875706 RepID=UPI001E5CDC8C|nr:methyltransferase domain-containing protein [Streptomyces gobiensis]UGY94381.1 methyltransferase domain-containing protein [Streptomyces gobiensis]